MNNRDITLRIKDKKIEKYIKKIYSLNIEIKDLKYVNRQEIDIRINSKDRNTLEKYLKAQSIILIDQHGILKISIFLKKI